MAKVKKRVPGKHALHFNDKHLTKQDHGGMCNINEIAQRYASGRLPYPENPPLQYGDISTIDVQRSRDLLANLDTVFAELPSEARDVFQTTENYIQWLNQNHEQIASEGLRDVLWDHCHPEPEVLETLDTGEISADLAQNGATGDDPPAT